MADCLQQQTIGHFYATLPSIMLPQTKMGLIASQPNQIWYHPHHHTRANLCREEFYERYYACIRSTS